MSAQRYEFGVGSVSILNNARWTTQRIMAELARKDLSLGERQSLGGSLLKAQANCLRLESQAVGQWDAPDLVQ
mgnify:CR=1 FL=1